MEMMFWTALHNRYVANNGADRYQDIRWAVLYLTRKKWRKNSKYRMDMLTNPPLVEKRRVKYLVVDDPVNGGWDKAGMFANDFYHSRKPFKHLSNYTLARLKAEWQ